MAMATCDWICKIAVIRPVANNLLFAINWDPTDKHWLDATSKPNTDEITTLEPYR